MRDMSCSVGGWGEGLRLRRGGDVHVDIAYQTEQSRDEAG